MPEDDAEIGATGEFPFGKPLIAGDQGALNAQFLINSEMGLAAFCFGDKGIGGFGLTHREARDMAARIRGQIIETFGEIDYENAKKEFYPITFLVTETEYGPRVMIWLPKLTTTIMGNPAFWLIFCDRLDAEAGKVVEH